MKRIVVAVLFLLACHGSVESPVEAPQISATQQPPPPEATVPPGNTFAIIVLPDTQLYTSSWNENVALHGGLQAMFIAQTFWIAANRIPLRIAFVNHVGDIVNNGNPDLMGWMNSKLAMQAVEDAGIPYSMDIGNHDCGPLTTSYNLWYGVENFAGRPYYGGHYGDDNDNHYSLFEHGAHKFVAISIEFDEYSPQPWVNAWADSILKEYPDRIGIVSSHHLLEWNAAFSTQGAAIYNKLRTNPNLLLMLCGHYDALSRRTDITSPETMVHTVQQDYQTGPGGGNGWLRIYTFDPDAGEIRVQTYSPWLLQYKTDPKNQFTLEWPVSPPTGLGYPTKRQRENPPDTRGD